MACRKQSLEKLSIIFADYKSHETDMVFRNLFATACYLSAIGEHKAGLKQVRSLFDWLGWDKKTTYFNAILDSFQEFASDYASQISANMEVGKIFDKVKVVR